MTRPHHVASSGSVSPERTRRAVGEDGLTHCPAARAVEDAHEGDVHCELLAGEGEQAMQRGLGLTLDETGKLLERGYGGHGNT